MREILDNCGIRTYYDSPNIALSHKVTWISRLIRLHRGSTRNSVDDWLERLSLRLGTSELAAVWPSGGTQISAIGLIIR